MQRSAYADAKRRSNNVASEGSVTLGQIDDHLRPPQRLGYLAGQEFDGYRPEGKPDSQRRVTDRLDEHHVFARQPGGFRQPTIDEVLLQQPGHRDGYRRLVAGHRAQVLQFLKAFAGDRFMDPPAVGTRQCSRSNTHSQPLRVVGRQHVGYLGSALPAHIRRGDITAARPRGGAHVPAVRGTQITGNLQVLGDKRRALVDRRPAYLDGIGQPAMQCGAIGFEL
jgi:hypothetical protein